DAGAADFVPESLDPVYPLAALAARGYRPQPGQPLAEGATLVTLEGDAGPEYWFGYRNFYVITRYNHSPMYAMAVYQLAQAIRGIPAPRAGGTSFAACCRSRRCCCWPPVPERRRKPVDRMPATPRRPTVVAPRRRKDRNARRTRPRRRIRP